MTSMRRSINPRQCAGRALQSIRPIRFAERRRGARRNSCKRRRNSRAASHKSAWSSAAKAHALRRYSSPASGWFRARAIFGAGTVLPPPHTRPPAQRGGSPNAAGSQAIEGELATARGEVEVHSAASSGRSRARRSCSGRGRSTRAMARGPACDRCGARRTCRRRARDQPQRRAHFRTPGGTATHRRRPRRGDGGAP